MTKCSSTVAKSSTRQSQLESRWISNKKVSLLPYLYLYFLLIFNTQPNPKSPYPLQTVTAVIDCRENTWDLYSLSQWQAFLSVAVFHAHPNAFNAPSVILSLTGPGWICLRLNDKTNPPSYLHLLPWHLGLYCTAAMLPSLPPQIQAALFMWRKYFQARPASGPPEILI